MLLFHLNQLKADLTNKESGKPSGRIPFPSLKEIGHSPSALLVYGIHYFNQKLNMIRRAFCQTHVAEWVVLSFAGQPVVGDLPVCNRSDTSYS